MSKPDTARGGRERLAWIGAACLALMALALLSPVSAQAVTKTWDGGCGAETAWSCGGNWSGNAVPAAGDVATFNATSTNDSTVDAGFAGSVATVKINSGYTGTIALARSLTVSTTFSQAAGAFTAAGQALTLKSLTLSGGSFTASSGATSVSGALTISGSPTFNANGGTVNFNGALSATLSCNGVAFNLVTFTNTAGVKTVGSACSLPLGANPTAGSGGSITLNGTLSGTGTLTTTKTLTLGATGSLSGFTGLVASALTVNGAYNFGAYAPFTVSGVFTLGSTGSFTAPSGTASFARNFTLSSGAGFSANGGTVSFNNTSSVTLACGEKTFNLVKFTSAAGHKTIGGDCTLPLGANPSLGKGGTALNGTLSGTGTLKQTGTFEIGGASPGLDSFASVTDSGPLLLSPTAVLTAPAGALTVSGNFTIAAGATFNANGGTVELLAPPAKATKTITCSEETFNLVTIKNGGKLVVGGDCTLPLGAVPTIGEGGQIVLNGALSGTGTLTANSALLTLGATGSLSGFSGLSAGALTVNGAYNFGAYAPFTVSGAFILGSGAGFTAPAGTASFAGDATFNSGATFNASSGTASFAGDFTNEGEFKANGGTVELDGAAQQLSGSTTFNNLTKIAESTDTLTFKAGDTQTIAGALILEGAGAGELLSLVSSVPGTPWLIEAEGSREVKWVSVADSTNNGATISAVESFDAGGNTGWSFP